MRKSSFLKTGVVLVTILFIIGGMAGFLYLRTLSEEITTKFDGQRWSLPALIYARALEIYPGMQLSAEMFEDELLLSGYRSEAEVTTSGGYNRQGDVFTLITREFVFPSGTESSKPLSITFWDKSIANIEDTETGHELSYVRLDPARIGSFHPLVHEDRLVLRDEHIPQLLKDVLMAVEDKKFTEHYGISPTGIIRAVVANMKAGKTVQGGSTLTQQLVKNFFLHRDRTLSRKFQEVFMALLLEYHYAKEEILTAYINEVFLGQDGSRAVHGFGLASQYFFRRELGDLTVAQLATLVGMVKGPSLYDPLRKPENCLERRNAVLAILVEDGIINDQQFEQAKNQPLTDVQPQKNGFNRFPHFLELVRRQLKEEYREEDLRSSGLKILTTLDPRIQLEAEKQLTLTIDGLAEMEERKDVDGAVVISGRDNGEVRAIVGGKNVRRSGFNRALDAKRPIGSLIKPAVYLTALARGYDLATPLLDSKIVLQSNGSLWKPKNYDNQEHGRVALYTALAQSYNLATVRLGVDVGLDQVAATIEALGVTPPQRVYPSLLLGAFGMSPMDVTKMYQTISSGGFYLPNRAIQAVLSSDNSLLNRYGLKVEQRFPPDVMFLLNHALVRVFEEGTASGVPLSDNGVFAGKTGTTNGLRDSWFAGYSADNLVVVWLGNDENESIALSGASGALRVWWKIMRGIGARSLKLVEPQGIVWRRIDKNSLESATIFNRNSTVLPFISRSSVDDGSAFDFKEVEDGAKDIIHSINELFR